jgi:hypothetical protein
LQDPDDTQLLTFSLEVTEDNAGGPVQLIAMSTLPNTIGTKTAVSSINANANVAVPPVTLVPGDCDLDGDVDINDMRGLVRAIQLGQAIDLSFDFNDDGVVNILDIRSMSALCTRTRCAA